MNENFAAGLDCIANELDALLEMSPDVNILKVSHRDHFVLEIAELLNLEVRNVEHVRDLF